MFTFDETRQHHANIKAFLPQLEAYEPKIDAENFSSVIIYSVRSLRVTVTQLSRETNLARSTISNWMVRPKRASTWYNRAKVRFALLDILQAEEQRLAAILAERPKQRETPEDNLHNFLVASMLG